MSGAGWLLLALCVATGLVLGRGVARLVGRLERHLEKEDHK
jgi:hypothetical protein